MNWTMAPNVTSVSIEQRVEWGRRGHLSDRADFHIRPLAVGVEALFVRRSSTGSGAPRPRARTVRVNHDALRKLSLV